MGRFFAVLIALLPAAVLLAWLANSVLPLWTAPEPGWLSAAWPDRCTAVASLRAHNAVRIDPPSPQADAASAAQIALDASVEGWTVHPGGLAVQASFEGVSYSAWLFAATPVDTTAAASSPFTALIWIDGQTNAALEVVFGLEDPAAGCDLNLRRALRETVLSPPFLLLMGYTGGLMIVLLVRTLSRRRRRVRTVDA